MFSKLCVVLFIWIVHNDFLHLKVVSEKTDLENTYSSESQRTIFLEQARRRCPLCDSSVFSYCSDKLFHDSCCCSNPNNPYYPLPPQCQYADCGFLHANSCQEHKLITACCCINHSTSFLRKLRP